MSETFDQEDSSPSQRLREIDVYVAAMHPLDLPTERAHFANLVRWNTLWVESIDRRITTEGSAS